MQRRYSSQLNDQYPRKLPLLGSMRRPSGCCTMPEGLVQTMGRVSVPYATGLLA